MTTRAPLLVAKIGGSLHDSPHLARWIEALNRWPHRLTLVCGGGPFADAVRAAQPKLRFSEEAAHAMAILAMEQYALALADLYGLTLAATREEIDAAHRRGQIALWRAARMVGAARDIAPGWDVTSDSLAAWLARQTSAGALLLIKSVDIGADSALESIASAGIVDPAFRDYVDGMPVNVAGPRALATAGALMAGGALPGAPVASATQKIAS
ncbi:uridylate kinase [Methylocystis iwaonis]|uniref:amino acid kinase family protein n=1 Tax=Methylocystis iwaonis TaxID=2885079 RepID=UPI002E7AD08B|nr:uridylate kinase [Methylocystis iwaonis]